MERGFLKCGNIYTLLELLTNGDNDRPLVTNWHRFCHQWIRFCHQWMSNYWPLVTNRSCNCDGQDHYCLQMANDRPRVAKDRHDRPLVTSASPNGWLHWRGVHFCNIFVRLGGSKCPSVNGFPRFCQQLRNCPRNVPQTVGQTLTNFHKMVDKFSYNWRVDSFDKIQ